MIAAIIQARVGSSRLPGKVLKKINGKSLVEIQLERLRMSNSIHKIILATTDTEADDRLEKHVEELGIEIFRGSENDVLDRFYNAAKKIKPERIVRITADCPLIDPILIDKIVEFSLTENADYTSNTLKPSFPDGQDVEVIKFSALEKAWYEASLPSEREHVTPYIWKNSTYHGKNLFSAISHEIESDYSQLRMTVDQQEDFDVISRIIDMHGIYKTWEEYVNCIVETGLHNLNARYSRNEGYYKSIEEDEEG